MRRPLRRTVFVIFGNAHKIAEVRFAFKKGLGSWEKQEDASLFVFELKTAFS